MAQQIAVTGILVAAATMGAALWARADGNDWRTSGFLVLGFAQLGVALAVRSRGAARHNPFLAVAVASAIVLHASAVLAPPLRSLLDTSPLPAEMWLPLAALSAIPGLLTWLTRNWWRESRGT